MKFVRKITSLIVAMCVIFALGSNVLAGGSVTITSASASTSSVHVEGTTSGVKAAVTIQVVQEKNSKEVILGMNNVEVKSNAFSGDVFIDESKYDDNFALKVKVADYEGGTWATREVPVDAAVLKGYQLRLDGYIEVDYYVALSDALKQDPETKVTFTFDSIVSTSREQVVPLTKSISKTADDNKQYNVFTVKVNASDMTLPITATLTGTDTKIVFPVFSVRDYAVALINKNIDSTTTDLCKALLSYGYYAQLRFAPNTPLFEEDKLALTNYTGLAAYDPFPSIDGVEYTGTSVVFLSGNRIRHYFKITGDAVSFEIGGQEVTKVKSKDEYYVATDIFSIGAMETPIELTIRSGSQTASFLYSPENYVNAVLASSTTSDTMKDLVKAYYNYYLAALTYTQTH